MDRGAVVLVLIVTAAAAAGQSAPIRTFDEERAGSVPSGFELAAMRQETPGTWQVRRSGTNGWLVHEADPTAMGYAIALAPEEPLRDLELSVRIRLAGGARVAGLVWQYAGPPDYHATVLDLDDGELLLFRVTAGNRVFLESEDGLELDRDAWHTVKVVHEDGRIVVSLGGIRVLEERDRRFNRRAGGGRVGLIVSGSGEAWFDDLRVDARRARRP